MGLWSGGRARRVFGLTSKDLSQAFDRMNPWILERTSKHIVIPIVA